MGDNECSCTTQIRHVTWAAASEITDGKQAFSTQPAYSLLGALPNVELSRAKHSYHDVQQTQWMQVNIVHGGNANTAQHDAK
jgi:hypothetical protein